MSIYFFKDLPSSQIKEIAGIHHHQWAPFNPKLVLADVERKFISEFAKDDKVPFGIADYEGEQLRGFTRIKAKNLDSCPNLTPWLSGFYVLPELRNKGIGTSLLEQAKYILKEQGYDALYLYTDTAFQYYENRGAIHLGQVEKNDGSFAPLFYFNL